jgi:hypothetical protein
MDGVVTDILLFERNPVFITKTFCLEARLKTMIVYITGSSRGPGPISIEFCGLIDPKGCFDSCIDLSDGKPWFFFVWLTRNQSRL